MHPTISISLRSRSACLVVRIRRQARDRRPGTGARLPSHRTTPASRMMRVQVVQQARFPLVPGISTSPCAALAPMTSRTAKSHRRNLGVPEQLYDNGRQVLQTNTAASGATASRASPSRRPWKRPGSSSRATAAAGGIAPCPGCSDCPIWRSSCGCARFCAFVRDERAWFACASAVDPGASGTSPNQVCSGCLESRRTRRRGSEDLDTNRWRGGICSRPGNPNGSATGRFRYNAERHPSSAVEGMRRVSRPHDDAPMRW